MPAMYRHTLSVGFTGSKASRLTILALLGLMGVPACGCLGLGYGFMGAHVVTPEVYANWSWLPFVLAGVAATGCLAVFAYLATMIVRTGAWVEGTKLTVRGLRTRTVDLATVAPVHLQPYRAELSLGRVRLRLSGRKRYALPQAEVAVLVQALATNPAAAGAVAWMRAMWGVQGGN